MTIQTSDTNNAISARKLISRNENGFDVELAAELIVANLAKLPLLDLVQEHPDGVRSVLLNPQVIDMAKSQIVEVGAQWRFEVQGYNDKASLIKQLPFFLELVEERMAQLPSGLRMEIVPGVSADRPRTRLDSTFMGEQTQSTPTTTKNAKP